MVFEESPISDRRSIPPVSRPSEPRSDGRSGWRPIFVAAALAALALGVTHSSHGGATPGALSPEFEKPRPVLITEAARRPMAHATPGHRTVRRDGAVVPRSAVIQVRGTPIVFISDTDYRFVATPVVLGEDSMDGQRIVSGVAVGQVIVSDGAEALKERLTL